MFMRGMAFCQSGILLANVQHVDDLHGRCVDLIDENLVRINDGFAGTGNMACTMHIPEFSHALCAEPDPFLEPESRLVALTDVGDVVSSSSGQVVLQRSVSTSSSVPR
jgi:hypothetical protein